MKAITFLPTTDLAATVAFYEGGLGLPLALDQGVCRIYRIGGGYWGFCSHLEPMADASRVILTLVVDDVPAWHAQLSALGLELDGPVRVNERFGIEHFFLTDPNGYRVEVQRFLAPFE